MPANAEYIIDVGLIPGSGRSPRKGNGNPFQYFCLENPVDRGALQATVHRVTKSQMRLKQLSMHTRKQKSRPRSTNKPLIQIHKEIDPVTTWVTLEADSSPKLADKDPAQMIFISALWDPEQKIQPSPSKHLVFRLLGNKWILF